MTDNFPKEFERAIDNYVPLGRRVDTLNLVKNCYRMLSAQQTDTWAQSAYDVLGDQWPVYFLGALIGEMAKTPLFDLANVVVASSPAAIVTTRHYSRGDVAQDGYAVALQHKTEALSTQTRRLTWPFGDLKQTVAALGQRDHWREDLSAWFQGLKEEALRGMIAVATGNHVAKADALLHEIQFHSQEMQKSTLLPPANMLAIAPELVNHLPIVFDADYEEQPGFHRIGTLSKLWTVFSAPLLNQNRWAVLWQHPSIMPGNGITMVLYYFGFTTSFEAAVVRSTLTYSHPQFCRVIMVQP